MPRLSKLEKSIEDTIKKLTVLKSKLDYRTYNAYETKIYRTNRKDTIKKINDELDNFQLYTGETNEKYTLPKIKTINKSFSNLIDKLNNISVNKTVDYDLDEIRVLKLSNKQIVKNILDIFNKKSITDDKYKLLLNVGGVNYTLTRFNQKRLLQFANNNFVAYEETTESDGAVVAQIINEPNITFNYVEPVSILNINNAGEFFKYYNNTNMNLIRYGIYENKYALLKETDKICLVKALRVGGLDDEKYTMLKTMVKDANIPFTQITKICETLRIQISVRRIKRKNGESDKTIFGKQYDEKYNIGLLDKHYFIDEETSYRKLMSEYYPNNNWTKSVKKDAKIDSFNIIKLLLSDKQYITQIPYVDLENTAFYKLVDDEILTLKYNEKDCSLIKNESELKATKKVFIKKNIFFDFETYTDENNFHIPYLCCMCYTLNDESLRQKAFIGIDCGKQMLLYLKKAFPQDNILLQLIAHNATYDYQFIVKYLHNFKEIKRGNRMLSANGSFFGKEIHIKCSYHLISTSLSKFGEMFRLEQCKEVMPYSLYNEVDLTLPCPIHKVITGLNKHGHRYLKDKEVKPFLDNIEKWGLNDNGSFNLIHYSKKYCEMDCIVLMNGYNTFRKWILELTYINQDGTDSGKGLGLDIDNLITSASLAHKYMIKNDCYEGIYQLGGIPQQFIQKCVVGGRTMSNSNKKYNIQGKIGDFDGVSLYPSAMKRMTGWLKGLPKIIKDCSYENVSKYDGYFVEVVINSIPLHRDFPLLSCKNKDGIRDFTNDMTNKIIYMDKIMLEDAIHFQGINDFQIIRGYYFDEGFNSKINDTIDYLFETRKLKKKEKNPIQEIYKLIMNSAYGKSILKEQTTETRYFHNENEYKVYLDRNYDRIISTIYINDCSIIKVESIASINRHQNIAQVGVSVLSWSKRIMNEVICLGEDIGLKLFYQDTDSIHMYQDDIEKLSDAFEKKYSRVLVGEELGQFHSDFEIKYDGKKAKEVHSTHLIVLGKKCYIDRLVGLDDNNNEIIDYHIRLKGVPNSTIEYEINNQQIGDAIKLYEKLYGDETINFDLTEGHGKARFQIQKNFGIKTLEKFDRKISFKK